MGIIATLAAFVLIPVAVVAGLALLLVWRQRRADPPLPTRLSKAEALADTQPIPTVGPNHGREAMSRLREHDHELSTHLFRQLIDQPSTNTTHHAITDTETPTAEPSTDEDNELPLDDATFQEHYREMLHPSEWKHEDR